MSHSCIAEGEMSTTWVFCNLCTCCKQSLQGLSSRTPQRRLFSTKPWLTSVTEKSWLAMAEQMASCLKESRKTNVEAHDAHCFQSTLPRALEGVCGVRGVFGAIVFGTNNKQGRTTESNRATKLQSQRDRCRLLPVNPKQQYSSQVQSFRDSCSSVDLAGTEALSSRQKPPNNSSSYIHT